MFEEVSLLAAFVAGFLSFISPCVLPLIPGYISFISGLTLEEMQGDAAKATARRQVLLSSVCFVLGFSLLFIAFGASATALSRLLRDYQQILAKVGGVVLVILGLHTMGVFRLRFLESEKRIQTQKKPAGPLGAFVVGLSFAFAWTPCIGPILGGILTLAASKQTVGEGVQLLAVYSIGLGIPFLLTAVAINHFFAAQKKIRRYYHAIEIVSGLLLIVIGLMIFFDRFTLLARLLEPYLPKF